MHDRLNLSLSSSTAGSFDDLPGEFNHVQYDRTYLAGHLEFTTGDLPGTPFSCAHDE
jgi:hypothetical protein